MEAHPFTIFGISMQQQMKLLYQYWKIKWLEKIPPSLIFYKNSSKPNILVLLLLPLILLQ